jgi:periplasmic protein CpxP/Spy
MKSVCSAFTAFPRLNHLILAGLLAAAGVSAMAQSAPAMAPASVGHPEGYSGPRTGHHDPAKMQAKAAKRQAAMKAKLNITPAQEGAWTSFTAAMQPPAGMHTRPTPEQRAEFDKLGTPERIDKMRAMRTQRMAAVNAQLDRRGEAVKTFYAALSPEQQKVFDAEQQKRGRHSGHGGHEGRGHPGVSSLMKG